MPRGSLRPFPQAEQKEEAAITVNSNSSCWDPSYRISFQQLPAQMDGGPFSIPLATRAGLVVWYTDDFIIHPVMNDYQCQDK